MTLCLCPFLAETADAWLERLMPKLELPKQELAKALVVSTSPLPGAITSINGVLEGKSSE